MRLEPTTLSLEDRTQTSGYVRRAGIEIAGVVAGADETDCRSVRTPRYP